ncbi:MAG: acyl-CoA synthetase [Proteobacteria bacterium]|nr:acyl-CoA synthetase [Pseudomonadota bacterium]
MPDLMIKTIQDVLEYEQTPLEKRMRCFDTYQMLRQGAAINPEAPAISFILSGEAYNQPMVVNYGDFMSNIHRTANLFTDLGIGPRDVVSYLLPNLPHTHYVLWGGEAAGIVNPINPLLEPSTIGEICRAAGTKVLVALGEFPGSDIWEKVTAVRKELPGLEAVVRVMGPGDEKEGIYGYDEVLPKYNGDRLDSGRRFDPGEIASIYHTGGTTGTPKLAPRTHLNEAFMAFIFSLVGEFNTGETMLCGLPLFHANGTTVTGSLPFSIGAHVVLLSPRGYRDESIMRHFYKIVEHYRAVTFSCVPTVLSVLLDVPLEGADISSLRYAVCGAAPLSVELFTRFETHSGMKILEGYGLTEGTCGSSANPFFGERKIGSIGMRLPYQDMRVYVVDDQGGFVREAEVDEIGSICLQGPNVFGGYLEEAHNQGIWPQPGWMNTGDLGRKDADDYFWLTGRKKELIIRGGHNIDPALIEDPLYRMPTVQVAAAVGWPDAHAGEVPVAYVQLQENSPLTREAILDFLKKEVGERAAVPRDVIVIDQMPLTPIGKIFKPALVRDAIRRTCEIELAALGGLAESIEVAVEPDKVLGSLANIRIMPAAGASPADVEAEAGDILGRFTFKYRIRIG